MSTIGFTLYRIVDLYELVILVACILSWFAPQSKGILHDLYEALQCITEPFLALFRRVMPSTGVGIDFSPVIAIIVLDILKRLLLRF